MTRAELRWSMMWALVVMAVTCVPYLYVAACAPPGTSFSGLLYAADDHCVYLSWAQQAAQGHFLLRNLFTGDAQRGLYVSLLSWLVGSLSRFSGVPLILVHHGMRVLFGALLLVLGYSLFARFTADRFTRRAAFWFLALSSGLGWLTPGGTPAGPPAPADYWQSEAVTFTCLYVNGLFCVALSLMVGTFLLLLTAEGKSGAARWGRVAGAGIFGLLLGNIHSYDVITLAGVWLAYLVARMVFSTFGGSDTGAPDGSESTAEGTASLSSPFHPVGAVLNALVAAGIALPSVAYQYYLYQVDPVFRNRADDRFLAPPIHCYLLGYGLVALLAVGGIVWMVRTAWSSGKTKGLRSLPRVPGFVGALRYLDALVVWVVRGLLSAGRSLGPACLPIAWAVVGFVLPYLPLSFQRKLVMGLHVPLAFLAAVGAVALARCLTRERAASPRRAQQRRAQAVGKPHETIEALGRPSFACAAVVIVLLLCTLPSDLRFMARDIALAKAKSEDLNQLPTFIPKADMEAISWVRGHLPTDGLIFCSTVSGRLIPALAGRSVYVGHWSETPRANERMMEAMAFYRATDASTEDRRAFLAERNIRYLYLGPTERGWGAVEFDQDPLFRPVYRNDGAVLYEVQPRTVARQAVPGTAAPTRAPQPAGTTDGKGASNG